MKKLSTRELARCGLFTAAMAVLSQIVVPLPGVPFNLGVLGVFLCGGLLRPGAALFTLLAYLLLGAAGAPVFAGFQGGPAALFGPTGGFLLAYPLMALFIALLLRAPGRSGRPGRRACFLAMAASLLPCYLLGAAWFALYTGRTLAAAAAAACLPFLPFDLLKALLAARLSSRRLPPR